MTNLHSNKNSSETYQVEGQSKWQYGRERKLGPRDIGRKSKLSYQVHSFFFVKLHRFHCA